MNEIPDDPLTERAQHLLRVLVESYIREGQPVGSRNLSRDSGLNLSAATVRNVMADLEEYGFVASPHTSAGRVPTDKGYRFFVDTLLRQRQRPDDAQMLNELNQRLEQEADRDPKALVAVASQMLSSLTHLAGVVTIPRQPHQSLSQIEFLPLSESRVLAVMVINGRDVQNRIVHLERYYSAEELRRAANFLNQQFGGKELAQIRLDIVEELTQAGETLNQLMRDAIRVAQQAVGESNHQGEPEYVIAGETNLMEFAELSNVEQAAPPVRCLHVEARHPAPARPEPGCRGCPDLHWPGIGVPDPRQLQPGHGPVRARQRDRRGPGRHRPDPHGLRPGHSHRRRHRPIAGLRLEFPPLGPI